MSIVANIGLIEPCEDGIRLTLTEIPGECKGQSYQTIVGEVVHPIVIGDMIWGGSGIVIIEHQDGARSEYQRDGYTTLKNGHIVSASGRVP